MSKYSMSRLQMYVLVAGVIGGVLLAISAGFLTRSDVITPVLAVGLTAPLGWAGMELLDRARARHERSSEESDEQE
jgi:hypothetical protein